MKEIRLARILTILFIAASLCGTLVGQTVLSIRGRVIDQAHAGIPGATIVLERADIRLRREIISDDEGWFEIRSLPPGLYSLTAGGRGFGSKTISLVSPFDGVFAVELSPEAVAAEVSITAANLVGDAGASSGAPGSIEQLDRITLENSRVFNFSEALRKISGVNVKEEEGFGLRPNIGIRGTNPTRSTKVLLLEDGIPLAYAPYGDNASYYHPPIERYASVEVLKGSSQIAYGPQTIAGVINYLTPNPTTKPSFAIKLIGGNRSYFNGSFTGSGTIKRTGLFVNYTRKQGDGARENTNARLNDLSSKVIQTINARNSLTFKFSYYGEDSNVTYSGLTEAEFAADPRANPFRNDFFYGDRYGLSASHTGVFGAQTFITTNFYFNHFKRHWWRQSSNSGQRPNRLNIDPDCLSMADLSTTCGNEGRLREYKTFGVAPRFDHSYGIGKIVRGELQGGFRLHWEDQFRRQLNGDLPTSRDGVPSEVNQRKNFAKSGFIQNRFIFGRFAVTPGVRFEQIDILRRNLLASPIAEGRTTITEVIPGVGITYSAPGRIRIFAGLHRGFSPPRAEDIIGNNGGVLDLDPERSWNYEVGVRGDVIKGFRVEGTFFRLDYENQIIPASLAGGIGATLTNGGKTLQQGFEFSGQFDSGTVFLSEHNFFMRTAYTWLPIAEFRGTRYSSLNASIPIKGNRLPYVPNHLITTSLGYSHSKGFEAFIENNYISRQFGDDLNTINPTPNGQSGAIQAQTYWNATVNYRVESIRTTFFVTAKNIFDRLFIVDRVRGILPSSPRLVQVGAKMSF
ncbi:TonB-dependent receptor plug domain-containing protein [Leptolyngbya sp. 7M]|uniref:TonB-dependent receptor plug domain-containing protein n=1 Tax=Leptolyngbya sp. 7M TaxID=2812896 RepID=UPI001B8DA585|nr:TonB-dependent receptor plug domain-containing protein [Leptolyngbya sp. 7M]QYO66074.1 TonB-dependent receptor plug domain-containing protein [Leptolyngbya sp. 7M]